MLIDVNTWLIDVNRWSIVISWWSIAVKVGKTMPFAPSPNHHHFYRWYSINHSQSWVVYDIVLTTLINIDMYTVPISPTIYFFFVFVQQCWGAGVLGMWWGQWQVWDYAFCVARHNIDSIQQILNWKLTIIMAFSKPSFLIHLYWWINEPVFRFQFSICQ